MSPWVPCRGDVVWMTLDPCIGHEQSGRRPVMVISPHDYNARAGLALFCPITTRPKGYPFEIPLPSGLPVSGVVLADQVRSLDWQARGAQAACSLPPETTEAVLVRLGRLVTT